ncbi:hypothetical protein ACWXWU_01740 [Shewanella sp. A14]
MAKSEYSIQTKQMLGLFISFIIIIVLAGLYIEAQRKVTLLEQNVERLTASQVLLMVPEDQADNIANWLTQHPEQTQTIIASADNQSKSVLLGPGVMANSPFTDIDKVNDSINDPSMQKKQEVVISENDQGVKVIRLPSGGIRVTTRDEKQDKQ